MLELEVMTELTEDEFYDNGDIAKNIAALLGINPKKIKIMDVVRYIVILPVFRFNPFYSEKLELKGDVVVLQVVSIILKQHVVVAMMMFLLIHNVFTVIYSSVLQAEVISSSVTRLMKLKN